MTDAQLDQKIIEALERERDSALAKLAAHTQAVDRFLREMHAIMIDPLADGEMNVEETCKHILEATRQARLDDYEQAALVERLLKDRAEAFDAIKLSMRCHRPADDGSDDCTNIDDCMYHSLLNWCQPLAAPPAAALEAHDRELFFLFV